MTQTAFNLAALDMTDHTSVFKQLAASIAEIGSEAGITIVPYRDPSLPHFNKLSIDEQKAVIRELGNYLEICQLTLANGAFVSDSAQLLWSALKVFKLRPTSDLFQFVREGSVIEIHNQSFFQIFRNFQFYACCSYSLEELHCLPWTNLYARLQDIDSVLVQLSKDLFDGRYEKVVPMDVKPHIIEELHSPGRYQIRAHMKYIAPLFEEKGGRVVAHVLIEDGSVLNLPSALQKNPRPEQTV